MSNAVIVPHDLPAPSLEVVPSLLVEQFQAAVIEAEQVRIVDPASFEQANVLAVNLHRLDKEITAHGETIKKPLNQLIKAVRERLDLALEPIQGAKRALSGKIIVYQREQQALADKARREAEEAARIEREKAEAERKRLQAIADAEHLAKVAAEKLRAEQEAKDLEALLGTPVVAQPVAVAPAPVVELVIPAMPVTRTIMPELSKAAVVMKKVRKVEITDPAAVPCVLGGIDLRPIDMAAVKRALDAGLSVPGAKMIEVEQTSMGAR